MGIYWSYDELMRFYHILAKNYTQPEIDDEILDKTKVAMDCMLTFYIIGRVESTHNVKKSKKFIKKKCFHVFTEILSDMPLHINSPNVLDKSIAEWRLLIGK
jgi:hypothetical protein